MKSVTNKKTSEYEKVQKYIGELYCAETSIHERRRADNYLQEFQKSKDALTISINMLLNSNQECRELNHKNSHNERFFSAKVVYEKLLKVIPDIDNDDAKIQDLSNNIWFLYSNACLNHWHHDVITKLSLCCINLCYRYPQLLCNQSIIFYFKSLLDRFNQSNELVKSQELVHALVLVLCLIPEEADNRRISIGIERRKCCILLLKNSAMEVIQSLESISSIIDSSNPEKKTYMECLILKSLSNWLELDGIHPVEIVHFHILANCFQALLLSTHTTDAVGVISSLIQICNSFEYIPIMEYVVTRLIEVAGISITMESSSEIIVVNISELLAEAGSKFISFIVQHPNDEQNSLLKEFLQILIRFCKEGTLDCCIAQLSFWSDFQTHITQRRKDYESNEDEGQLEKAFSQYTIDALWICIERSQYPMKNSIMISHIDLNRYRNEIRNFLRSLLTNLSFPRKKQLLESFVQRLFLAKQQSLNYHSNDSVIWIPIEVYIHAISAIAGYYCDDQSGHMSSMMDIITSLPKYPQVLHSSCMLLSVIPTWLKMHPKYLIVAKDVIQQALRIPEETKTFVMRSKQDHVAAVAIIKIAMECRKLLIDMEWIPFLIDAYSVNIGNAPGPTTILYPGSQALLLQSFAYIVSDTVYGQYHDSLHSITQPLFGAIKNICILKQNQDSLSLCLLLEHISILSSSLKSKYDKNNNQHPLISILIQEWDVMKYLFNQYISDESVMEALCTIFINLANNLQGDCKEISFKFLELIVLSLECFLYSCFVDTFKAFLSIVGEDEHDCLQLSQILKKFSQGLENLKQLKNQEEYFIVLSSVFGLVCACGSLRPRALLESNCFLPILQISLDCLNRIDNINLLTSACTLFSTMSQWYYQVVTMSPYLIDLPENQPKAWLCDEVEKVMTTFDFGPILIKKILITFQHSNDGNICEILVGALHSLWRSFEDEYFKEWFLQAVAQDNFPRAKVSYQEKQELVRVLCQSECAVHVRKFRRILNTFLGKPSKN